MTLTQRTTFSKALAAFAFALAISLNAHAAPITWNNSSTTWATGSSWTGNVAPTAADIAVFNSTTTTNQPTASAANSIAGITVGDGATAYSALTFGSGGPTIGASGIWVKGDGGLITPTAVGQANVSNVTLGGTQTWTNDAWVSASGSAGLKTGTVTAGTGLSAVTLTLAGGGTSGGTRGVADSNNFSIDILVSRNIYSFG